MQQLKILMLNGKDYFTEAEAAHYLGVSERKFRDIKKQVDLQPINSFGKNLYRRSDLRHLIENQDTLQ